MIGAVEEEGEQTFRKAGEETRRVFGAVGKESAQIVGFSGIIVQVCGQFVQYDLEHPGRCGGGGSRCQWC